MPTIAIPTKAETHVARLPGFAGIRMCGLFPGYDKAMFSEAPLRHFPPRNDMSSPPLPLDLHHRKEWHERMHAHRQEGRAVHRHQRRTLRFV
jgi:hypothetical protein